MASTSSPQAPYNEAVDKPTTLACIECRRKHVKCDAGVPECRRCRSCGLQCHYQPSRRGLKRRIQSAKQSIRLAPNIGSLRSTTTPLEPQIGFGEGQSDQIPWNTSNARDGMGKLQQQVSVEGDHWAPQNTEPFQDQPFSRASIEKAPANVDEQVQDDELLINLFYANFHVSHPFLVPRSLYFSQSYPSFLKLVVHLIGCHFSGTECSDTLQGIASEALDKARNDGQKGFVLVQALLLFSIALHARNDMNKSNSVLEQAVALALDIGMHRREFSITHSRGSMTLEESLRRTWWELYVTDGFMAAPQRKAYFRCHAISSDVPLPCDEFVYAEGALIMEPRTLDQFDSRIYMEEEPHFSPFCYRIDAVRMLARAMAVAWIHEVHQDQIQTIDNALAGWAHHLGPGKTEPVNASGDIDEMLFQAHILIHYTAMYLHFPRSDIPGASSIDTEVTPHQHLLPVYSRSLHGFKALEASGRLVNLVSLKSSVQKHTPFLFDCLLLSAAVQLFACPASTFGLQERYRDHLYLATGVLKTLSPVWALARETLSKIRTMALKVIPAHRMMGSGHAESRLDSAIDVGTSAAGMDVADLQWMDFPNWPMGD